MTRQLVTANLESAGQQDVVTGPVAGIFRIRPLMASTFRFSRALAETRCHASRSLRLASNPALPLSSLYQDAHTAVLLGYVEYMTADLRFVTRERDPEA